jgi:hypothetical protein
MSDLGTRWISPQWNLSPITDPTLVAGWMSPRICVVNPGPVAAKVTVEFRKLDGTIHSQDTRTIPPHQSYGSFFPEQEGDDNTLEMGGWVNIFSDQPIAPCGTTVDQAGGTVATRVNMTFFRLDEIHVQPIKPT